MARDQIKLYSEFSFNSDDEMQEGFSENSLPDRVICNSYKGTNDTAYASMQTINSIHHRGTRYTKIKINTPLVNICNYVPSRPVHGDMWTDSKTNITYVYSDRFGDIGGWIEMDFGCGLSAVGSSDSNSDRRRSYKGATSDLEFVREFVAIADKYLADGTVSSSPYLVPAITNWTKKYSSDLNAMPEIMVKSPMKWPKGGYEKIASNGYSEFSLLVLSHILVSLDNRYDMSGLHIPKAYADALVDHFGDPDEQPPPATEESSTCVQGSVAGAWVCETATPFLSIPRNIIALATHPLYHLHYFGGNKYGGRWNIPWHPISAQVARYQLLNIPYVAGLPVADTSTSPALKNSYFQQPGFYEWAYSNPQLYPHSGLIKSNDYRYLTCTSTNLCQPDRWVLTYSRFPFSPGDLVLQLHPYAMHWAKEKTGLDKADKFTQAIQLLSGNKAIFHYAASSSDNPSEAIYGHTFDGVYETQSDGSALCTFKLKEQSIVISFSEPAQGWSSGTSTTAEFQNKKITFNKSNFSMNYDNSYGEWGEDGELKTDQDVLNPNANYPNSFFPW